MEENRLERVRATIDDILRQQPDEIERRCGFVHLYGVAAICALLALKRGLDPQLCTTAGMLHDIWAYKCGGPTPNHDKLGAVEAERILRESGDYTDEEIALICTAIANHSDKRGLHADICELLKDADVLQHHLYNTSLDVHESRTERLGRVFGELGI